MRCRLVLIHILTYIISIFVLNTIYGQYTDFDVVHGQPFIVTVKKNHLELVQYETNANRFWMTTRVLLQNAHQNNITQVSTQGNFCVTVCSDSLKLWYINLSDNSFILVSKISHIYKKDFFRLKLTSNLEIYLLGKQKLIVFSFPYISNDTSKVGIGEGFFLNQNFVNHNLNQSSILSRHSQKNSFDTLKYKKKIFKQPIKFITDFSFGVNHLLISTFPKRKTVGYLESLQVLDSIDSTDKKLYQFESKQPIVEIKSKGIVTSVDLSLGEQVAAFGLVNGKILVKYLDNERDTLINTKQSSLRKVRFAHDNAFILSHHQTGELIFTPLHPSFVQSKCFFQNNDQKIIVKNLQTQRKFTLKPNLDSIFLPINAGLTHKLEVYGRYKHIFGLVQPFDIIKNDYFILNDRALIKFSYVKTDLSQNQCDKKKVFLIKLIDLCYKVFTIPVVTLPDTSMPNLSDYLPEHKISGADTTLLLKFEDGALGSGLKSIIVTHSTYGQLLSQSFSQKEPQPTFTIPLTVKPGELDIITTDFCDNISKYQIKIKQLQKPSLFTVGPIQFLEKTYYPEQDSSGVYDLLVDGLPPSSTGLLTGFITSSAGFESYKGENITFKPVKGDTLFYTGDLQTFNNQDFILLSLSLKDKNNESLKLRINLRKATTLKPKLFILAIGVSHYDQQKHGYQPLKSSISSCDSVISVFKSKYGVPDSQIIKLYNQKATRTTIIQTVKQLNNQLTAADDVFLMITGHGGQVLDGRGSRFVAYDYHAQSDLLVDGLDVEAQVINQLLYKPRHLFIFLDYCYSGLAITQSGQVGTRGVSQNIVKQINFKDRVYQARKNYARQCLASGTGLTPDGANINGKNITTISAASYALCLALRSQSQALADKINCRCVLTSALINFVKARASAEFAPLPLPGEPPYPDPVELDITHGFFKRGDNAICFQNCAD